MNPLGNAWLLDRSRNCIEVNAHPSESFEFESVVDVISQYGSGRDKANCEIWRVTKSDASKAAILNSYYRNWCKVRLWEDNKLTFRIASPDHDWYRTIVDFLTSKPHLRSADISVGDMSGKIYWNDSDFVL